MEELSLQISRGLQTFSFAKAEAWLTVKKLLTFIFCQCQIILRGLSSPLFGKIAQNFVVVAWNQFYFS